MLDLVSLGKALSDPVRVRVLHLLLGSEACVCELEDAMEVAQARISTHLQTLRSLQMVTAEKRGSWVIYRLMPESASTLQSLFAKATLTNQMHADKARMVRRLGLRVDGCCVLGAGQLKREA